MEPALKNDNYLFVKKWIYGPRVPVTPLSIPFISSAYISAVQLPYIRIPGIGKIKQGDIVAFNFPSEADKPVDRKSILAKRIIGLPGDTIEIRRSKCIVNQGFFIEPSSIRLMHRIVINDNSLVPALVRKYHLENITNPGIPRILDVLLHPSAADSLSIEKGIINVRRLKMKQTNPAKEFFPQSLNYSWSGDDFGPLIIPAKGLCINLNPVVLPVYLNVIQNYEGNKVEIRDNIVIINGIEAPTYTFKMNYYFVLDDQRDQANDSRYWGFLPEDHIIGIGIGEFN